MIDAGFRLLIDEGLRHASAVARRAQDRSAVQVQREFIRQYVASKGDAAQGGLFDGRSTFFSGERHLEP